MLRTQPLPQTSLRESEVRGYDHPHSMDMDTKTQRGELRVQGL